MMALARQVSTTSKWPEIRSQVVSRIRGGGSVLQVTATANHHRFEASVHVNDLGGVLDFQMAAMLREIAWMIDGKGEPPAWEMRRRNMAEKRRQATEERVNRIMAGSV